MEQPDQRCVSKADPQLPEVQAEDVSKAQRGPREEVRSSTWGDLPREDIYKAARWLVKGAATVLVLAFGYLQLSGSDWSTIGSSLTADVTFKVALALYYGSWVAGLLHDTALQEGTYSRPPNSGRMPMSGVLSALALSVAFGLLCLWAGEPGRFAALLAVFIAINFGLWKLMLRRYLAETVKRSEDDFRENPVRLERLHFVFYTYLSGRWQASRFTIGALWVLALNVVVHAGASEIVVAAMVLGFVIVFEGWIWFMRVVTDVWNRTLEELGARYELRQTARP
jgi:hypothetical protein